RHRLDAFGHHCLCNVLAASAAHLDLLTTANSHLVGKLRWNLDERLWHKLNIHRVVLCPIVIMFSQSIRRADDIESLIRSSEFVHLRREFLRDRVIGLVWMQWIRDRAFDRFVMLWERSVGKGGQWAENATDSFRIHNEWSHMILRLRVDFEIGHIVADPLLL